MGGGDGRTAREVVRKSAQDGVPLVEVIGDEYRDKVLAEAQAWAGKELSSGEDEQVMGNVVTTSYEGSKGRSAQYVFLVGLHSGEMPKKRADVQDIEICRFLVGLTRTKKKCFILVAKNAMGKFKQRSEFIGWIKPERFLETKVDATFWR